MQACIIFGRKFLCQASYPQPGPFPPSLPPSGPYLLLWIKPYHLSSIPALSFLSGEVTWHDSAVSIFPCFDCLGFQHQLVLFWVLPRMGRLGKQQSGLLALQVVDSIWLSLFIHEFFLCCQLRRFACFKDSSLFPEGAHLGHTEGPNAIAALVTLVAILPVRIPPTKKSSFPLLFLKEKNKHVE